MSGRDLIGIAKTGSGKTIAFLLPMFRHILDQRPLGEGEGPIGMFEVHFEMISYKALLVYMHVFTLFKKPVIPPVITH